MLAGIDQIYIYNISLLEGGTATEIQGKTITHRLLYKSDTVFFKHTTKETEGKEDSIKSHLSFNPNKILTGNNLSNSSSEDVREALEFVVLELEQNGIKIDLRGAKVSNAAFNINFPFSFEKYRDTFYLIMFQKSKKVGYYGKIIENIHHPQESKISSYYHPVLRHTKRILYNKALEAGIDDHKSRFEVDYSQQLFQSRCRRAGLQGVDLWEFLDKLEEVLRETVLKDLDDYIQRSIRFLETKHEKRIAAEMYRYKANKRQGVYKYLDENFKVFDREFLKRAYKAYDKSGNYSKEVKKIEAKYKHLDTINQLGNLYNYVFGGANED